jgi:hypothetical protein
VRPEGLAFCGREVGPGLGELLPELIPCGFLGSKGFRRRSLCGAFALEGSVGAAEPGDLPCLGGIGMMGEPPFAADGAGLPVEFAALERHGDGGAGRAEDRCLGGEGAGFFGGFGALAVGVAPGALVASFAVGAASSGGAVAVGTGARDDGGGHGGAVSGRVAVFLWDGVTKRGSPLFVRKRASANDLLRTPKSHLPPRRLPELGDLAPANGTSHLPCVILP